MNARTAGYLIFYGAFLILMGVLDGNSEKLFAAILITLMLAASALMLPCLLKARKPPVTLPGCMRDKP